VKSELDGTISGLDTEFDSITKLINSVNKETVSHTEISNIQKELIEYVHKFSDIIKIISEAGRLISEELRRIQETYTENVRDEILIHLGDILGLEYDPIRKELIGDLSAMLEIIALKDQILELINRMNNWESALGKLENNMGDSNDRLSALGEKLDRNILDLGDMNASLSMQMGKIIDGITSTTGLTYDPETGQLMGDLSIKSDLEYVQDRLSKTRTELEKVKTDLSRTKVNLEEQRDMLNDTEVYIQESKEELELTRDVLNKRIDDAKLEFDNYLDNRGGTLVDNGNGEFEDNTNFPGFDFVPNDSFASKGSFTTDQAGYFTETERPIPINPTKTYKISMFAKSENSSGTNYIGHTSYDKDLNRIESQHTIGGENPILELAQDVNYGDTVIYVKSTDGLKDDVRDGTEDPEHT